MTDQAHYLRHLSEETSFLAPARWWTASCACGWVSPSRATAQDARALHTRHQANPPTPPE